MQVPTALTIVHYNDVYDVEGQNKEPVGGATRFCTAVNSFAHLNPLVLFSGDCFSPSLRKSQVQSGIIHHLSLPIFFTDCDFCE